MPKDDPDPLATGEVDPDKTVFFQHRPRHVNLLPIIVASVLVLGSGAVLTWALTRAHGPDEDAIVRQAAAEALAKQPMVSSAQARALENPPEGPVKDLATPTPEAITPVTAVDTPAPAAVDPNAPLNLNAEDPANATVRAEVLQRIDLMPNLSAANKDKLYASVDHARKMGRVLTCPFQKGETAVHAADIERLKHQVQSAEIKPLLDDPTVVFVVLGYADPKGSDKINAEVSANRAHSVLDALRDQCGFQNVMHAVAMGGSTLFSTKEAEKNRVVEIWAVVP